MIYIKICITLEIFACLSMGRHFSKIIILIILFEVLTMSMISVSYPSEGTFIKTDKESKNSKNPNLKTGEESAVSDIPKTLHIGDNDNYNIRDLDPDSSFHPWIQSILFDPLINIDLDTGDITPGIAYQWVVTNDSTEWTFFLRNDVIFHDGSKLNASQIKFSFDRLFDPSDPYYINSYLADDTNLPIQKIEIVSEFVIKFDLSEPYSLFINRLPKIPIISPNSFNGTNYTTPIGTGPYKFDFSTSNMTFYNFTRISNYYRGLAPFENIIYESFYNKSQEFDKAIETNQLDLIFQKTDINPLFYESNDWNITKIKDVARHDLGWFNFSNPILSDVVVRKAINYAIDKNKYVSEIRNGLGSPAKSIIPKNILYHDENITGYPYNVELANQLLDDAGYVKGEDEYRFELKVVTGSISIDRGQFVCNALENIGIKCDFQVSDDFFSDFDIYVIGFDHIPEPGLAYDLLNSNGLENFGGYSNPNVDSISSLSKSTPVRQEQEFFYTFLQKLAQNDAPYILLANVPFVYVRNQNITSFVAVNKYSTVDFYYQTQSINSSQNFKINSQNLADLNYKIQQMNNQNKDLYSNVQIALKKSIYLPFVDAVITSKRSTLSATVEKSTTLDAFIPSQSQLGKFYKIDISGDIVDYNFRVYYDFNGIPANEKGKLSLFQWNFESDSWEELNTFASNNSLRFIEVILHENSIIGIGESILRTSALTPIISSIVFLAIVGVLYLALWTIRRNYKNLKELNDKYDLYKTER